MKRIVIVACLLVHPVFCSELFKTASAVKELVTNVSNTLVPSIAAVIENSTTLHGAIKAGQLEELEKIPRLPELINYPDSNKRTPLHYAAINGNLAQINWLLDRGAESDIRDYRFQTALHLAVMKGSEEVVRRLVGVMSCESLDAQDAQHMTAVHYAVNGEKVGILRILVQAGARIDLKAEQGNTVLHMTVEKGSSKLFTELRASLASLIGLVNDVGETALHIAAIVGSDFTGELVSVSPDIEVPTVNRWTPLFCAVHNNRPDTVKLLRSRGAQLNGVDREGKSPLCIAAAREKAYDILEYLLADSLASYQEDITPIVHALEARNFKALKLLLEVGQDKEKRSAELRKILFKDRTYRDGKTALHLAVIKQYPEAVEILIGFGALVEWLDDLGRTPLSYAVGTGNDKIIDLLLGKGANPNIKDRNLLDAYYYAVCAGKVSTLNKLRGGHAAQQALFKGWKIYGASLLHAAGLFGHDHLIDYLVRAGIDINQRDKNAETALHFAVLGMKDGGERLDKYKAFIQQLLRFGADRAVRNRAGYTAEELAQEYKLTDAFRSQS